MAIGNSNLTLGSTAGAAEIKVMNGYDRHVWDDTESESDFYGNDIVRARIKDRLKRKLTVPFQYPVVEKKIKTSPDEPLKHTDENHFAESSRPPTAMPTNAELSMPTLTQTSTSTNVLDFLRSRPQISALKKDFAISQQLAKREVGRTLRNGRSEAEDLVDTPDRFAAEHSTANLGPWLWVDSPKVSYRQSKLSEANVKDFKDGGKELLEAFNVQKAKFESDNPDKSPAALRRYLRPFREQLEDDLLALAVKTNTTSGKWMLFPTPNDVPRVWRIVAEATAEGKLGSTSKVATYDESEPYANRLICVYTQDFSNEKDVRRVLDAIEDLGVCPARGIFYKCDAYTHLGLGSDNPYKIRASVYSSTELQSQDVKALKDGPIARLHR